MAKYHPGELELQERTGQTEAARRNGKMIGDTIPSGARRFLERQRLLAVGHEDAQGRVWASVWFGEPGFVHLEDERTLCIEREEAPLRTGDALGVLAIELESRRRFRVNGVVAAHDSRRVTVRVMEAYANCPQYIQRRRLLEGEARAPLPDEHGVRLDPVRKSAISAADTLFVASRHPSAGADVSHRGGNPGFVRVLDDTTLRIPDYPGNGMFNTLGNLRVEPRAGLAILDFERGRVLCLTGTTELFLDCEDAAHALHPEARLRRHWDFHVGRMVEISMPASFHWEFLDASPYNP
ncbi:MAG: pyridoxamine 5'-phosphate oxidase family protein [Myxococcales bacterium]|nr:pyridoxamine 5'-phosphate oxidase family protein [Myxococcales bacterium]